MTTTQQQVEKTTLLPRGVIDFAAGAAGGTALVLVGHPFDTMKVRMQTNPQHFTGTIDTFKKTLKHEGAGGFYKGIGSPLVGVTAVNAIAFFSFNQGRYLYYNLFGDKTKKAEEQPFSLTAQLFGGAFAGVALAFVEGPVELIKAKLQVQTSTAQYSGSLDCAKKIIGQHGIRGIFQGFLPTLYRNVPANVSYFAFYEWLKQMITKNKSADEISPLTVLAAGGAAGAMYWISCFPMDVIKSRMQTDHSDPAQRRFKSITQCASEMYRAHGLKSFYWGFVPCLLRALPANASCFFTYEIVKKFLSGVETTKQPTTQKI